MTRVGLVGCGKAKGPIPAPAAQRHGWDDRHGWGQLAVVSVQGAGGALDGVADAIAASEACRASELAYRILARGASVQIPTAHPSMAHQLAFNERS